MISISVIIPCHNEKDSVLRCIESVRTDAGGLVDVIVHVVVVDDGSTDGTNAAVRGAFAEAKVVTSDGSLWWSGAINKGVEFALAERPDYVLLLNNDCVLGNGAFQRFLDESKAFPKSILSAVIGDLETGKPVCFGGKFSYKMCDYWLEPQKASGATTTEVDWLPGHTMFVPAGIFAEVGMMDAKAFPQYFGDADFSLRAKRFGYSLRVISDLLVLNDRDQTGVSAGLSIRPRKLLNILTSRRSWMRLDDNLKFWWRHRDIFSFLQLVQRYEFVYMTAITRFLDALHVRSAVRAVRQRCRRVLQRGKGSRRADG